MTSTWERVSKPLRDEFARQKREKEARKAVYGDFSLAAFLGRWFKRIFYTFCFIMITYVLIVGGTIMVPTVMGYLIASMGYAVSNNAEMLLSLLAGLFFTGWTFLISFLIIRFSWRRYISGMKGTVLGKAADKLDALK